MTSSSNLSVHSQHRQASSSVSTVRVAASRAPRSVSNYSVTFRNPTSQFLEQLSVEAQRPELGIDDTPVSGRTVNNKSHLTALGHAAQLKSRSVSGSQADKSRTGKDKAVPARSSTIAIQTPVATSSSSSRSPSATTSPRRRPQSYLQNSSAESSGATSLRKPGANGLGHGLPTSPGTQAKRSAEEMERSASLQSNVKPEESGKRLGPPSTPEPAARRKTWFGIGWAADAEQSPTSAVVAEDPKDSQAKASEPATDQPPPPMNEDEAAFRRSLGFNEAFDPATKASQVDQKAFPVAQDSQAPIKENSSVSAQIARRERRVSWLPWRNVVPVEEATEMASESPAQQQLDTTEVITPEPPAEPMQEEVTQPETQAPRKQETTANEGGTDTVTYRTVVKRGWMGARYEVQEPPVSQSVTESVPTATEAPAFQQEAEAKDSVPEGATKSTQAQLTLPAPQEALQAGGLEEGENTVTYKTVVKRGWMGARYEVQEPVSSLQAMFDPPQTDTPRDPDDKITSEPKDPANTGAQPQPEASQIATAYPPAAPAEGTRQDSGTWRWRFWSGHEGHPEPSASSAAQQLEVPNSLPPAASAGSDQPTTRTDAAEPMDIDQEAPALSAAPPAGESGSWTYSSYVASWVPTWVYNAQQQAMATDTSESAASNGNEASTNEALDSAAMPPPRTPAEQVKADALAREVSSSSSSAPVLDANKAVLNSSTKSGWINFFASRSANLPQKMPETIEDQEGMEVMDISDVEGPSQAATARDIASNKTGGSIADAARAPRARTTTGGSVAGGSKASSLAGDSDVPRAATPLSTSKESIKNLSKAAITKAANATAASTFGLGKGKRSTAAQGIGVGGNSSSQPAKDISKNVAPNGPGPSRSGASTPTKSMGDPIPAAVPNLVLPSFEDTFTRAPRMWPPKVGVLERTLSAVNSYLFSKVPDLERMKRPTRYSTYGDTLSVSGATIKAGAKPTQRLAGKAKTTGTGSSKDKGVETALKEVAESAQRLPRAWSTVGMPERAQTKGTAGIAKIVVIGVHGWFTQSIFKNMIGEQTGTSAKFAAMQTESIRRHFLEAGLELNPEAITAISLQGDGKVADRVDRLFAELISRPNWVNDLKTADAVFLSAHSQGAIVATQLLARLIEQRHVQAEHTRICLLSMCGIHHGPFAHLRSSITTSYINYFETAAAKELFEFQSSTTSVSKQYTAALKIILDAGAKCVYVGSTDDNVVPIYSALNSSNNHPSILRALYIDGQAFPKVDFLTNLLVLCVAVRNAGLGDHNLLTLLSASVAGSLYGGRGHSNVYEERGVYDLATRYLFEVTHPLSEPTFVPGPPGASSSHSPPSTRRMEQDGKETVALVSEAFEAQRWNPYELPWALRGLFEDKHVRSLYASDMLDLLQSYERWRPDPKSKALRDLQWRLAPIRSIAPPPIEEGEVEGEGKRKGEEGEEGVKDSASSGKGAKL